MKQMEFERCVVCGKLTDVPKTLPVGRRKTYVSGGGQLCKDCCWRIYGTTDLRETPIKEPGNPRQQETHEQKRL